MSLKTTPLLQFKNITIIKGNYKKIIDRVTATIHEGENVAILGPNGAGKSSFIKAITREHYPILENKQAIFKIWGQNTALTSKKISRLFDVPVEITNKDGYYYAFGY